MLLVDDPQLHQVPHLRLHKLINKTQVHGRGQRHPLQHQHNDDPHLHHRGGGRNLPAHLGRRGQRLQPNIRPPEPLPPRPGNRRELLLRQPRHHALHNQGRDRGRRFLGLRPPHNSQLERRGPLRLLPHLRQRLNPPGERGVRGGCPRVVRPGGRSRPMLQAHPVRHLELHRDGVPLPCHRPP